MRVPVDRPPAVLAITLALAACALAPGARAQHDPPASGGVTESVFEPLAIERSHTLRFDMAPAELFELMNPAGGNHWARTTPAYIFGSAGMPEGSMWKTRDTWLLVADYDAERLSMKTVLYIPDVEFMIEEARCVASEDGGTVLEINWRVAGLSRDGNAAVQGFFDTHWEKRMERIEASYSRRAADEGD